MEHLGFLKKAIENLEVANKCFGENNYNACVNRAYYAMFQTATALLIKNGKKLKAKLDHSDIISSFVQKFCNKKKVVPQFKSYLKDVQEKRNIADYKPDSINQKTASRVLKKANEFIKSLTKIIEENHEKK